MARTLARALLAGTAAAFVWMSLAAAIRRLATYLGRVYEEHVYEPWFLGLGFEETAVLLGLAVAAFVYCSDQAGMTRLAGRATAVVAVVFVLITGLEDADTAARLPLAIVLFGGIPALAAGAYRALTDAPAETAVPLPGLPDA